MVVVLFLAYLAVIFSPLALSAWQDLPARSLADELAAGAGLVVLAILLVEFALSGRYRAISRHIGMDVTMRFHQLVARTALALVIIHPLLYTRWDRANAGDPTRHGFARFQAGGLLPGILAFLLLGALVAMALNRSELGYRYEIWRALHAVGAVAVAALGTRHATRLGRYSQDEVLVWVWWCLFTLALLSVAHAYCVKPVLKRMRPWRVASVTKAAERMWHVTLAPEGHAGLSYKAGQFGWANFGHSALSLSENPFSIASAPSSGPEVSFLIKELGDLTRRIGDLAPGTRAYLDAPYGHLTLAGRTEPGIALIAGGVGIAPIFGILREMRASGDRRPSVLVYGNRHEGQIAFREELDGFARDLGTEIVHVLSEPPPGWTGRTGFPDRGTLEALFGTAQRRQWLFVLCGPPVMLDSVEDSLIAMGIPPRQILSEKFVYD